MPSDTKQYLGDGVYADFDGDSIILTTENGVSATNTIYLDRGTLKAFDAYRQMLTPQHEREEAQGSC